MREFLKGALEFIRQNPTILYSLVLIVILPVVIYSNTFSAIESLNKALKESLNEQAAINRNLLALVLEPFFPEKGSLDLEGMQKTIDMIATDDGMKITPLAGDAAVAQYVPKLVNIRVIVKEGNVYKAIAAQNKDIIGKAINVDPSLNGQALIAYNWTNPTQDVGSEIEEGGEKYFRIIKPLIDKNTQEVYALVVADISTNAVVDKISQAIFQSYVTLVAVIVLVLFLVFQHTKLFSYVALSKDLQVKNKAKDDFIRMATHELRSPVTVINMYMETLKEEITPVASKEQKEYLERSLLSIRNLRDLMSDILEVSHIQQGRTDFKPEKIFVGKTVKEIIDGIRPKAEDKGLALLLENSGSEYVVNVNSVCFNRIITNLVENSVKYTPSGKVTVSISSQLAKKRCVIMVQDTGFGISAEGQAHLFEQFYRVKTEANAGIPGTGLGLWMSREMARKMGGDIMIESIENMGSRFFVYFPLADK